MKLKEITDKINFRNFETAKAEYLNAIKNKKFGNVLVCDPEVTFWQRKYNQELEVITHLFDDELSKAFKDCYRFDKNTYNLEEMLLHISCKLQIATLCKKSPKDVFNSVLSAYTQYYFIDDLKDIISDDLKDTESYKKVVRNKELLEEQRKLHNEFYKEFLPRITL